MKTARMIMATDTVDCMRPLEVLPYNRKKNMGFASFLNYLFLMICYIKNKNTWHDKLLISIVFLIQYCYHHLWSIVVQEPCYFCLINCTLSKKWNDNEGDENCDSEVSVGILSSVNFWYKNISLIGSLIYKCFLHFFSVGGCKCVSWKSIVTAFPDGGEIWEYLWKFLILICF
jgi:hypothetical protein